MTDALPRSPTPLIGRERDLAELGAWLADRRAQLVTLTGPGGVGKTRLAIAAAAAAAGDARFVPLAALSDPALVLPAVARSFGVHDRGDESVVDRLATVLAGRPQLLVLDNFEHVLDAAGGVADLLAACPELTVLVTSRTRLRLPGEQEYAVAPLSVAAGDDADSSGSDAVRLFLQRARAVKPDFEPTGEAAATVVDICRRLDGLPLAIELAAARIKVLPPATMLARLMQRRSLLSGGGSTLPARQQTMRDAVAWSYDLLTAEERTLFRRLAVFIGGFALDAAESIASDAEEPGGADVFEGVAALVDASLLLSTEQADGSPRFGMLETMRDYGLERLAASGEADAIQERHAAFFADLAERAAPAGKAGPAALPGHEPKLRGLEAEEGNLRAALAFALSRGDAETGLRLAKALGAAWMLRGRLRDVRIESEHALAVPGADAEPLRAPVLVALGWALHGLGEYAAAEDAAARGLDAFRALGDASGTALALDLLGVLLAAGGDLARARAALADALEASRTGDDPAAIAWVLHHTGSVAALAGDPERAAALYDDSIALWREIGDRYGLVNALYDAARLASSAGHHQRAATKLCEALAIAWSLRAEEIVAPVLDEAAALAALRAEPEPAVRFLAAANRSRERTGIAVDALVRGEHEQLLAKLRARADAVTFAKAWTAGRSNPLSDAVAEADGILAAAAADDGDAPIPFGLSRRELEVLRLLAAGRTNRAIAEELFIGVPTVKVHVRSVLTKLGLDSRTAAAAFAIRHGLA